MTKLVAHKLDFRRKLFLSVCGLVAVAVPIMFGLLKATQSQAESQTQNRDAIAPVFEVASIKPDKYSNRMFGFGWFSPSRFTATGATVQRFIREAYGVEGDQIAAAPHWLNSERYDVDAKIDGSLADELQKLTFDQRMLEDQRMLQALLADRCKLTLHRETKELPLYALVIAKNGPKLQEAKPGDTYPDGIKGIDGRGRPDRMRIGRGLITGQGVSIALLVRMLSRQQLGRPVLDKTGLTGKYDFTLQWTPDVRQAPTAGEQGTDNTPTPDSSGPSIFTSIQEQLGLRLESQKGPAEILFIDLVEKPSEN